MVGSIIDKTDAKSIFEPFQKKSILYGEPPMVGCTVQGMGAHHTKFLKVPECD